ncbi:MAG: SDR family NAD(P)-dependent oxidoreductase [Spirochaetota bacterium]
MKTTQAPKSFFSRMKWNIWQQAKNSLICPQEPTLEGKLALITGGNNGIGLETAKGLGHRKADVIIAARNIEKTKSIAQQIAETSGRNIYPESLDLSDLNNVVAFADALKQKFENRTIDICVANAGIWPSRYLTSKQGYEIAFAVNVLGHYVLIERLFKLGLLKTGRVVIVTGDIYTMAKDCTPDFQYSGRLGGQTAYCRSKLANLWLVHKLAKKYPQANITAVHPGVIATDLGGGGAGFKKLFLLEPYRGAQTSLYCASQADVVSGAYYHNTMGRVILPEDDSAMDLEKAQIMWEVLEKLAKDFI